MNIGQMFAKSINREIKPVVKPGQVDDATVKLELQEYVVTQELQKHFAAFFSNYRRGIGADTDRIGVWISGFFGSGKSHFLKMLSYLISDKEVAGKLHWNILSRTIRLRTRRFWQTSAQQKVSART